MRSTRHATVASLVAPVVFFVFLGIDGSGRSAFAQATSGAQSLNITPGARADGMGRAHVALPEDATANWWNPAALADRKDRVFSLMHAALVPGLADDVYYEFLGYSMPVEGWGGIGVSFIYLGYGKSIATDGTGRELGEFTSYELSPQVSLGTNLAEGLSAGITLKYVYINLAPKWATQDQQAGTGDTFGADIGMLYRMKALPLLGWPTNVGVNVQNLGPKIAYIDQDQADDIGRNLKVGFATRFFGEDADPTGAAPGRFRGLLAYDINQSLVYTDETPIHNFGAEVSYDDMFALRMGYIQDTDGDITDTTFGVGFAVSRFTADYASVPQADGLDRVSKFSLSYNF